MYVVLVAVKISGGGRSKSMRVGRNKAHAGDSVQTVDRCLTIEVARLAGSGETMRVGLAWI